LSLSFWLSHQNLVQNIKKAIVLRAVSFGRNNLSATQWREVKHIEDIWELNADVVGQEVAAASSLPTAASYPLNGFGSHYISPLRCLVQEVREIYHNSIIAFQYFM
jgi:hypothetical protein